ncbi:hypothetical protein [Ferrimonas pelagia]|uniref:Carbamoyltransferase Kae1-like domain-containing protein n=1 Tax=Ferrimonas pelagia TaxID=1177826 RepID=A0ABP9ECZ6_9GAMM
MKLRFSFHTEQAVPIYARLCNQILQHPLVKTIGRTEQGYAIEAEGDEAELSALAELIGKTFPLSCWLTHSETEAIEQFDGEAQPLAESRLEMTYCRHCRDLPSHSCRHCDSVSDGHWLAEHATLERWVQRHLDALLLDGRTEFDCRHGHRELLLLEYVTPADEALLFCQPQALADALHIGRIGQLALSGLEKPQLRLVPRYEFVVAHNLPRALYQVQLADERLTLALCDALAARGICAVAIRSRFVPLQLSHCDQTPIALSQPGVQSLITHPPRQQRSCYRGIEARWDGEKIAFSPTTQADTALPLAAAAALEGVRRQDRVPKRSAVLYLSKRHDSGLLYRSDSGQYRWLVRLPEIKRSVRQCLNDIEARNESSARLMQRCRSAFGDSLARAERSELIVGGSVSDAMAMAAWLLELEIPTSDDDQAMAAEALIASALQHDSPVAPRIDAELAGGDGALELQWLRAFQSCLSYRLAGTESASALAYGFIDSFCDFVATWVEQLDADYGLDEVILAGDEFENPVLLDRLFSRLDRNVKIRLPSPLDLAGATLAMGGLFVDPADLAEIKGQAAAAAEPA